MTYDITLDGRRRQAQTDTTCASSSCWQARYYRDGELRQRAKIAAGEWAWASGDRHFCSLDCAPIEVFGLKEKEIRR